MTITAQELSIINISLHSDDKWQVRQFTLPEMEKALSIFNKIKEHIVEDEFQDGEIELNTEEKALLLKVTNRAFPINRWEAAISLRKLLT